MDPPRGWDHPQGLWLLFLFFSGEDSWHRHWLGCFQFQRMSKLFNQWGHLLAPVKWNPEAGDLNLLIPRFNYVGSAAAQVLCISSHSHLQGRLHPKVNLLPGSVVASGNNLFSSGGREEERERESAFLPDLWNPIFPISWISFHHILFSASIIVNREMLDAV